jgi:two-component system sensor histidine kinase BaeS
MKRLLLILVPVLAIGIVVTELTMDLDRHARVSTYSIYATSTVLTVVLYVIASRILARAARLATAVAWVGVLTVVVAAVAVVLAANSMIVNAHDRDVMLVVLGMGIGLAASLALAIGGSAGGDLGRIRDAARRMADGDLAARTGVERRDEVGDAAHAFDEMAHRLQISEEERKILIASVGHDLRTPLASIRAALEAVEDGVAPDPVAYLSGMSKDVEHLGRLIDDLFDYARIESGRFEPKVEPIDLRELVDETVEVLTPVARSRGVALAVAAGGPAPATVDPSEMGRVLRNLVDNAIRYTPPGSTVTVEAVPGGFTVIDEGEGFPAAFRAVAFDRFTRADAARGRGGSGLGLAIARGIVEAHGGRITIEDGPGGRVRVTLR